MTENKNIYPNTTEQDIENPDLEEDDDDSEQAFIARLMAASENLRTVQHDLIDLYQTGQYEVLNEKIEELAHEEAMSNDEFTKNMTEIKNLQSYRNPDKDAIKQIVTRQNELIAIFQSWIVMELGLPDDARFNEIEKSKNTITELLADTYPDGNYTPLDALQTLNIISIDENDDKTYRFPEELVPESTNELWKTYLAAVCKHVKTQRDLSNHVIDDKSAVEQADKTRTYAHNAVTKDVHAILGLEGNDKWDFQKTRQLLAHIRDEVFPTIDSPLSEEGLALISHQSAGLGAIDCLCSKPKK